MREILFRGKRADNGEWVEGCYAEFVHGFDGYTKPGIQVIRCVPSVANRLTPTYETELVEVTPETVGQSTGLLDKNGKKIFEGDVVVDRWANEYTPVFQNGIYMAYNPKHLTQNGPSTQFNVIWKDGCEIIGNIHDEEE